MKKAQCTLPGALNQTWVFFTEFGNVDRSRWKETSLPLPIRYSRLTRGIGRSMLSGPLQILRFIERIAYAFLLRKPAVNSLDVEMICLLSGENSRASVEFNCKLIPAELCCCRSLSRQFRHL